MRHPRSAALLTATALAGVSLTLAFAPSATAAVIPTPPLGTLVASPSDPVVGDLVRITGDGCFTLASHPGTNSSASAGTDAAPTTDAAPVAAADDPTPVAGAIAITITGPDAFSSNDTATASDDGTWSADQGITVGDAGDYTVSAKCTLTDPVLGQSVGFDYADLDLTVAAPPSTAVPVVNCAGCDSVKPGGTVTVSGTGFPNDSSATIALPGYTSQTSRVDNGGTDGGAFAPVQFVIRADQAAATLSGTVTAGSVVKPFSVAVVVPETPGDPTVDGPILGDGGGDTDTDTGDTDTTPVDVPYTSSAPSLPNTGTDSLWQGVLGGALVLTGGGLLWLGRRREDSGITAA